MAQASASNTAGSAKTSTVKVSGSPKSKFQDFSLDYGKFLTDDYAADKLLVVKYTGKGQTFVYSFHFRDNLASRHQGNSYICPK
jgi:hypothetical protein